MLKVSIQKEHGYHCLLYLIINWKSNFTFPLCAISKSYVSVFVKENNSVTNLMVDLAMFDWSLIGKKQNQKPRWYDGKNVCYRAGVCSFTWWLPSTDSLLLKSMGPSPYIPVDKISLNDKLSICNDELWTINYV